MMFVLIISITSQVSFSQGASGWTGGANGCNGNFGAIGIYNWCGFIPCIMTVDGAVYHGGYGAFWFNIAEEGYNSGSMSSAYFVEDMGSTNWPNPSRCSSNFMFTWKIVRNDIFGNTTLGTDNTMREYSFNTACCSLD